ncbi:Alkaline phosphatase [Ignavibacterium album JCM 16511]|uniref:Alkaline phosphatase n=1 Tax=Ignavibacterium album (strain DSM 19864 / JCM 16511 / NBRC 101810 / Mat9-16) TaxID=945713 RepID=I0ANK8_IGNAJ|nr:alkaline phosphatase [Ignavibacterium album]AFH50565.1 Alkaline phosphatase [Ignavibacterium album JCM 16511]
MLQKIFTLVLIIAAINLAQISSEKGNVIFIHPDGTGLSDWNALRIFKVGPDNDLNWDKMNSIGLYQGHIRNRITASSNAGATIHAYGVKADVDDFGLIENEVPIARSGNRLSIMKEAMQQGVFTGIINSGSIEEPGTAVFVSSNVKRGNYNEIAKDVIQSGADLIFSGGEDFLLPEGTKGRHSQSGKRKDGLNLIEWAKSKGYKVVYTKEELLNTSFDEKKILGIFAARSTFNDRTEEELREKGLPNYNPTAPTVAEMTKFALEFLFRKGQFFLVVEEEGTDNFGNRNNANGKLEALSNADEAIGFALKFINKNPNTLLLTASDSEAGGLEVLGYEIENLSDKNLLPEKDANGSPVDGREGTGTLPFISAPDKNGNRFPFAIGWSCFGDVTGGVVARAHGMHSEKMKGKIDNTDIYRFMYMGLFGKWLD